MMLKPEYSAQCLQTALELTRLVVENPARDVVGKEQVFETFLEAIEATKKAYKAISKP